MMTHTGEKPYKSDICANTCIQSESMKRHTRLHTGKKSCKYDICGEKFTWEDSMKKHMRLHIGEKPHIQSHQCPMREKPHTCNVC